MYNNNAPTTDASTFDWASLENGVPVEPNSKKIIIDHLKKNGIPGRGPDLQLFQKNGILIKDDFATYLSNDKFYSTGSFAKLANGTPADFQYDVETGLKQELERFKDKSAWDLGSFVHEAILEPHRWDAVVCEPKANRTYHKDLDMLIEFWYDKLYSGQNKLSTKETRLAVPLEGAKPDEKKQWIQQAQTLSGLRSIDFKDALIIERLHHRWSNYEKGFWAMVLHASHREVSCYTDSFMELPMRVRPDGILFENQIGVNAIVSIKTTSAPNLYQYKRQVMNYGYDVKEAAYQAIVSHITGVKFDTTINIVLSTTEPFHVGVFIYDDSIIRNGLIKFSAAVAVAKEAIQKGSFPGWECYADEACMSLIDLSID